MDDPKKLAESVRSGRYFAEARAWYQAIYIAPISARTMFLLIAGCAAFVALLAVISVSALLPVTERPGLLIDMTDKTDRIEPHLVPLNKDKNDLNEALASFYVKQFVLANESWDANESKRHEAFLRAHTTREIFDEHVRRVGMLGIGFELGGEADRRVTIKSVSINPKRGEAKVAFDAAIVGSNAPVEKTQWTAKLKYTYTPIMIEEAKEESGAGSSLEVTDPTFQVTEYVVESR